METASRNPPPVSRPLHLTGEEITGGSLPVGVIFAVGAALPPRWGLVRWAGRAPSGPVEVVSPALPAQPLPLSFSRLSLLAHNNLARVVGSLRLSTGHELAVLERPPGEPLETLIASAAVMDPAATLATLSGLAGALDLMHGADICHLELRPEHVTTRDGAVWLLPTGAARSTDELQPRPASAAHTNDGVVPDEVLSVCAYLAPEQFLHDRGSPVDRRADVYALAVLSHQLLTGGLPFGPDGAVDTIAAHLSPQRPRCTRDRPELSEAVEQVLLRGYALSPFDRYPSCGELIDDLRAALAMLPASGRRLSPQPSPCILVVAGTAIARLEMQGMITAAAPRNPVLTDGGPHGRTLALRYCPRLCLLHQPSLPPGGATRLVRQLQQEPLLQRTRIVAVVEQLGTPVAQELQRLGVTLAALPAGSGYSTARSVERGRPLINTLRRLLMLNT